MFATSKLFKETCPDYPGCKLSPCLFSHTPEPSRRPIASSSRSIPAPPLKRTSSSNTDANINGSGTHKNIKVTTVVRPTVNATPRQPVPSTSTSTTSKRPLSEWDRDVVDRGPPRLGPIGVTHTPSSVRQKMLSTLYEQFLSSYSQLPNPSLSQELASKHALAQEATIYSRTNKSTYRTATIQSLARLKKRPPITSVGDTGTLEDEMERNKEREEREKGRLTRGRVGRYVAKREDLIQFDYLVEVPEGRGGDQETEEGNVRKCDRCGGEFVVRGELDESTREACAYHYGRMITEKIGGLKQRVWSCCPTPEAAPCQRGPHVFKDDNIAKLHSRFPFILTSSLTSPSNPSTHIPIIALDCELIYTTSGLSLARLTVISEEGSIILDEHVKPQGTILDLNTRFSGVKKEDLDKAVLDLGGVREALGRYLGEEIIVVGHGLENDLKALRLVHLNVIDTAIIFPHPKGKPFRHALRNLTRDHLGKFIQDSDPSLGHSAVDDSRAALELVRFKMKQDRR